MNSFKIFSLFLISISLVIIPATPIKTTFTKAKEQIPHQNEVPTEERIEKLKERAKEKFFNATRKLEAALKNIKNRLKKIPVLETPVEDPKTFLQTTNKTKMIENFEDLEEQIEEIEDALIKIIGFFEFQKKKLQLKKHSLQEIETKKTENIKENVNLPSEVVEENENLPAEVAEENENLQGETAEENVNLQGEIAEENVNAPEETANGEINLPVEDANTNFEFVGKVEGKNISQNQTEQINQDTDELQSEGEEVTVSPEIIAQIEKIIAEMLATPNMPYTEEEIRAVFYEPSYLEARKQDELNKKNAINGQAGEQEGMFLEFDAKVDDIAVDLKKYLEEDKQRKEALSEKIEELMQQKIEEYKKMLSEFQGFFNGKGIREIEEYADGIQKEKSGLKFKEGKVNVSSGENTLDSTKK